MPAGALAARGPRQPSGKSADASGALAQLAWQRAAAWSTAPADPGLWDRPRAQGPRPVHGLARDRAQPRRQERLRRLLGQRRDRGLQAQRAQTGALSQPRGAAGCIAAKGAGGCATAIGLDGPNSVAVSPDGRNVYATSRASNVDRQLPARPRRPARCTQLPGQRRLHLRPAGTRSARPAGRWSDPTWSSSAPTGRTSTSARSSATRSPSLTATRQAARSPSRRTARLHRRSDRAAARPALPWALRRGWRSAATAPASTSPRALSNAVVTLGARPDHRRPRSGQRRQRLHRRHAALSGCTAGRQLDGANAVAISPDGDDVYVTSLFSNSVTAFTRSPTTGDLAQKRRDGRLPGLAARGRLLLRPRDAARPRGWPSRPTAPTSTSRPSPPARSTSSIAAELGKVDAEAGPPGLPRAALGPRLHARRGRCAGSARSRSAPTAAISTRPRSAATPSTSSGGTDERIRTGARAGSPARS